MRAPQLASADDVAALEWLDLELRTVDARRPRVVDELANAVSVAEPGTGDRVLRDCADTSSTG